MWVWPLHSRLWPRINYFRIKSPKCAWQVVIPAWQVVFLPYSSVESVGGSWSCPEAPFSHTPLFALVKLDLSIFCKEEALALHTSVFWPYSRKQNLFRIKNYPRKLSRLSKIGLLELPGALQRAFFTAKISIFCINNSLALHTIVFWSYSRKENLFRIKKYPRKLSWLSKIGLLNCQEHYKECCISGD